jgi:UDP-N-acetylmuramyl pentapeptide phosphotransferase/UDP-N-acetylglucosamine-1-phosphate transferase
MVSVNLSDSPNYRSIHNKTNPTGGGLGIIAALGFSLILINTFIPEVSLSRGFTLFFSLRNNDLVFGIT